MTGTEFRSAFHEYKDVVCRERRYGSTSRIRGGIFCRWYPIPVSDLREPERSGETLSASSRR